MGSKIWLIAVLLLLVNVGLEAFPVTIDDGLYKDDYEMDYSDVEDSSAAAAASDDDDNDDDDDDGNELGLEDPRWGGTLIRLPRPRDRRPRSPRPKRKNKKSGKKRKGKRGGKKSSSKKDKVDHGRPPRRSENKKGNKKRKAFPVTLDDGLYENEYEMDYPDDENDGAAAAAAAVANDDDDGNKLAFPEDYEGALDEMGLEDPRWGRTLKLPQPRDRRPRAPRRRGKKKKVKRPRRPGGKRLPSRKGGRRNGRRPRPWG